MKENVFGNIEDKKYNFEIKIQNKNNFYVSILKCFLEMKYGDDNTAIKVIKNENFDKSIFVYFKNKSDIVHFKLSKG